MLCSCTTFIVRSQAPSTHPSNPLFVRVMEGEGESTYRSWLTLLNSALFCGLHWILKLAVSTNCPTVALNPDRNALNGYHQRNIPVSETSHSMTAIPLPDAFPPFHPAPLQPTPSFPQAPGGNSHNSPPQPHTQTAIPPPRPRTP